MRKPSDVLIVVAVVAILAGMLLPALNMAKEKAKQADCMSKLKQIGLASYQYAMSYDDCFPASSNVSGPKWRDGKSGVSLDLLRSLDLLTDPKCYICPSKKGATAAQVGKSLDGHVTYNWCDGLGISEKLSSTVLACDGVDNHSTSGRFLRGDGSVWQANGTPDKSWIHDSIFKNACYDKDPPDYSF